MTNIDEQMVNDPIHGVSFKTSKLSTMLYQLRPLRDGETRADRVKAVEEVEQHVKSLITQVEK